MGTKRTWGIAAALLATSVAGSATRAQDAQTEERIKKQLEDKKRAQEANQKRGADADARSNETPEQKLARSKLLADSEHDYEKALALVQTVERDEKNPSDLRAQALVVASRCLNQLGRTDEARASLKRAAQLNGPAADEAKRLLDAGLTDQQLELRIAKAIEELFSSPASANDELALIRNSQTAKDLIWLGAPAVPRLVRVLGDSDHLANVTGAAYLLAAINSEEVAGAVREAVRRPDPLYKRAILKGIAFNVNKRAEPTRSAVMTMLEDPDVRVREWMLVDARELAELSEIVPLTLDPEDRVRIAAWNALSVRNTADEKLVEALRRCLKEDHDPVRLAAVDLFGRDVNKALFRFASARTLFVESLLDPVLTAPGQYWHQGWSAMGSVQGGPEVKIDSPVSIDLLVKVGNALGPYARDDGAKYREVGDHRNRAWAGALSKSSQAVSPSDGRVGWPVEDREKVWPLLRLGVGMGIKNWVVDNARAGDLSAIAENSVACGQVTLVRPAIERVIAHPTSRQGEVEYIWTDLPSDVRTSVAKSLLKAFDTDVAAMDTAHPFQDGRLRMTTDTLIKLGTAESDDALVRALQKAPETGFVGMLLDRRDPPVDLARVAELVTIPLPADSQTFRKRNEALGRLAAGHVDGFTEVLARCYEQGLEPTAFSKNRLMPCGIVWMVSTPSDASQLQPTDGVVRWAPGFSETELRGAFEACAKARTSMFWPNVQTAVSLLPKQGPFDPVGQALLEVATRHLAGATATSMQQSTRKDLIESLLYRRAPGWEELALAYLTDPDLGSTVLNNLPAITPEMLARVAPSGDREAKRGRDSTHSFREGLVKRMPSERDESIRARIPEYLKDPDIGVREAAIGATLSAFPDRAVDLILPMAKDEESGVRFAVSESLGSVFDRRVIPVLVDLLQDPSEGVRGVAKKSLDSIQYVFEQKEKWKRVLEGAGLDSANAAEALVKQAAAGQPKATRLVAIESLGTLGVAETLPVLIQFMGDADAEVAAAAKEAVARINRQSKAGKDAKPSSDH